MEASKPIAPDSMKPDKLIEERRLGEFVIDEQAVLYAASRLLTLFKHMIVVRCELQHTDGAFHYQAYSPLFAPVPQELCPPYYVITMHAATGEISVQNEAERDQILMELNDEAKATVKKIIEDWKKRKEEEDGTTAE